MSLLGHGVLVIGRDTPDLGLYYVILYASSFDTHTLAAWYTSIVTRHFPCLPRRREWSASVKPCSEKKKINWPLPVNMDSMRMDAVRPPSASNAHSHTSAHHLNERQRLLPAADQRLLLLPLLLHDGGEGHRWGGGRAAHCSQHPGPEEGSGWGGWEKGDDRQTDRQTEGVSFGAAQKSASAWIKVESTTNERLLVGDGAAAQLNLTILLLGSNKRMGKIMQLTPSAWCQIRSTVNDAGWHYQQDDNVLISPHQNVTVFTLLQHLEKDQKIAEKDGRTERRTLVTMTSQG